MNNVSDLKIAKITGLGAIQIEAMDPALLADWYTNKFGITIAIEHEGNFYGEIDNGTGKMNIGIVRSQNPYQFSKNMSLTFKVGDFSSYLKKLEKNGLTPISTAESPDGSFAFFSDPEENRIGIWG